MNARERYYLNHHLSRLLAWQIEQAEKEMARIRAERRERLRAIRWAHKCWKLGIRRVIADNVNVYNRAILKGF